MRFSWDMKWQEEVDLRRAKTAFSATTSRTASAMPQNSMTNNYGGECDSEWLASAVPAEPHQEIEQRENGLKLSGHIRPSRRVQHLSDILLVLIRNHAERRKLRFGTPACIELDRKIDDLK